MLQLTTYFYLRPYAARISLDERLSRKDTFLRLKNTSMQQPYISNLTTASIENIYLFRPNVSRIMEVTYA